MLKKIFGLYLGFGRLGNTFSPAIVVEPVSGTHWTKQAKPARIIITLRTRGSMETTIYWRGAMHWDWNSDHLARRFGAPEDAPHGSVWRFEHPLLGNHMLV